MTRTSDTEGAPSLTRGTRRELTEVARHALARGDLTLAGAIRDLLRHLAPSHPHWIATDAGLDMATGLLDVGLAKIDEAARTHPASSVLLERRMDYHNRRGAHLRTIELSADPALHLDCEAQVTRAATALADDGHLGEALDGLERLAQIGATDPDLFVRASRLAVATGQQARNAALLKRLQALHPAEPYGHLGPAHGLIAAGRLAEAKAELERLDREAFPDHPLILGTLCDVCIDMPDAAGARAVIARLQGKTAGRRIRDMEIRLAASLGDWAEVARLADGTRRDHHDTRDRILAAHAKIHLGDTDGARTEIDRAEAVADGTARRGNWFAVARQVAAFRDAAGTLADDPGYRFAAEGRDDGDVPARIQMLWVGGALSPIERLSVQSFLDHGFDVDLYTYGEVGHVPDGATLRDGAEILPADAVFAHSAASGRSRGSYAGFADIFRWHLLRDRGGFWADADIVCLRPFRLPRTLTISSEVARTFGGDHMAVTNCFFGGPAGHPMFVEACARIEGFRGAEVMWGEMGTRLIGQLVADMGLHDHVLPPGRVNGVRPYRMIGTLFAKDDGRVTAELGDAWGLHLYNEVWRSHGVPKAGPFPRHSLIHTLLARHGIEVPVKPARLPIRMFRHGEAEAAAPQT